MPGTRAREQSQAPWGHTWRSSDTFIVSTMGLAIFTDELLFAFMLPLLPTLLEQRIGTNPELTQRYTSIFLAEGAFVSVISSPIFGSLADAVSSKRTLLMILLGLTLIGVTFLALTTQLVWFFVGRFFQCITSNGLWIVGMATMAENLGSQHMGKIAALTTILTAAGTTGGPVLCGLLFHFGGYWCAWIGPALFVVVDIIMRLLMLEKQEKPQEEDQAREREQDPLLEDSPAQADGDQSESSSSPEVRGWRFYALMLHEARFSSGVFCAFVLALLLGCIQSTLAVHVRTAFGWGALHTGLLLAWIQGPGIVFATPVGWMKDRYGSRTPTAVGFLGLSPLVILSGIPGSDLTTWVTGKPWENSLYFVCMALIGCWLSLLNGIGTMQATETIDVLEARKPGISGPYGGYSRALAIINMTWMGGLMIGPLLAELVIGSFGFFELQCCLGEYSLCLYIHSY
ncbi:major facilitator superfamily domain-containing protein [Penicillium hetheringtonii]|uniref:Major facilitator superfamily domain-containing protein n=1 Tax=Penicillium hetheringtonii TaxID=911720 RepID=A0AAD6DDD0_9EURO|nr:major facilitator superfamily domain-containing protein [Penicillium hetheringtonii]